MVTVTSLGHREDNGCHPRKARRVRDTGGPSAFTGRSVICVASGLTAWPDANLHVR